MVCKYCNSSIGITYRTKGIATSLTITCDCRSSLLMPCNNNKQEKNISKLANHITKLLDSCNTLEFGTNHSLIVFLLQSGNGYQTLVDLCGFLGLDSLWSSSTFQKCEHKVCYQIEEIGSTLMDTNSQKEQDVSPVANRLKDLVCSFNLGWQQCGSRNIYNSASRHGILLGQRTGKVSTNKKYNQ